MTKLRTGRIRALAKHIEDPEKAKEYSQDDYEICGSPQCIAGHAVALWGDFQKAVRNTGFYDRGFHGQAKEILGLTYNQAERLFTAVPWGFRDASPTREDAVRTLRHLARSGKVSWSAALKGDPALQPKTRREANA